MLIKRLKLQNFAQHRSLDKEIKGNLIGVLGKNGCGKTNFLNAIRFAFTGDADGTKESMISHGLAEDDKKGFVEMWFVAHGKEGYIKRALHSQTRTFTYGDTTYKKDAEINTALKELFGMDKDMLRNLTFIRQGELQKLLFGDPAERESNFIKIFGLGHTEAIRATLMSKIEMLEHHVVDLTQLIDENRVSLQKQEEIVKDLEVQSADSTRIREDWALSRNLYETVVDIDKKYRELDAWDAKRSILSTRLKTVSESPYVMEAEISKRRDLVIKLDSEITSSNETAKHVASRNQLRADRDQCRKIVADQEAKERDISGPMELLPGHADLAELEERITRTKRVAELTEARDKISSNISWMDGSLKKVREDLIVSQKAVSGLAQRLAEAVEVQSRLAQVEEQNKELLENLTTKTDGCECPFCLSSISNVSAVTSIIKERLAAGASQLAAINRDHSQLAVEHGKASSSHSELVISQVRLQKDIEAAKLQYEPVVSELEALVKLPIFGSTDELARQERIAADKKLRRSFEEMLKTIQGVTAQEKQKLAGLESTLEKFAHVPETVSDMTSVADQLHHTKQWLADSDKAVSEMNSDKGSLKQADEERGRLSDLIKGPRQKEADIAALLLNMDNAEKKWTASQEIIGRLDQAKQAANGFKLRLAELEGNVERGRKTGDLVNEFKKVREVLERRNLPLTFIQQYFKRLLPRVQTHLGTVGADFIVKSHPSDPVSFMFDRVDGTCLNAPVEKLSGGQKVRLVVAFLFALHEVMSSRMGFLVLDEPTVFLDDTGVESFGELLSDIVIRLQSSDMQVLISTHEQSLKPNFSSCIQLGNAV